MKETGLTLSFDALKSGQLGVSRQRHRGLRVDMLASEFRIAPDIAGSTNETGDDPLAIC
jgi:hypothetical protein